MKSILALVLLMTTVFAYTAQASDAPAASALLSILPVGQYYGVNDEGVNCSIIVNEGNFPDKVISVTAIDDKLKVFKIINENVDFLFRAHKAEFIQSERHYVSSDRTAYVDNILRTINADNRRLYVVVSQVRTVNRDVTNHTVECVINY